MSKIVERHIPMGVLNQYLGEGYQVKKVKKVSGVGLTVERVKVEDEF